MVKTAEAPLRIKLIPFWYGHGRYSVWHHNPDGTRVAVPYGTVIGDSVPKAKIGKNVTLGDHAIIGKKAIVGDGCILGRRVLLGDYSELGEKVELAERVRILQYSSIGDKSQLGFGCEVGESCNISYQVVLGDHCVIQNGASIGSSSRLEEGVRILTGVKLPWLSLIEPNATITVKRARQLNEQNNP